MAIFWICLGNKTAQPQSSVSGLEILIGAVYGFINGLFSNCLLPASPGVGSDAAGDVDDIVAGLGEHTDGAHAAAAGLTDDVCFFFFLEVFVRVAEECIHGDVFGGFDRAGAKFVGFANIDEFDCAEQIIEVVYMD